MIPLLLCLLGSAESAPACPSGMGCWQLAEGHVAWLPHGPDVHFQLQHTAGEADYLAVGLSSDGAMGRDLVLWCNGKDSSVGLGANPDGKSPTLLADRALTTATHHSLADGMLHCHFKVPNATTVESVKDAVPFVGGQYHLLLAVGPLKDDGGVSFHSAKFPSPQMLDLNKSHRYQCLFASTVAHDKEGSTKCNVLLLHDKTIAERNVGISHLEIALTKAAMAYLARTHNGQRPLSSGWKRMSGLPRLLASPSSALFDENISVSASGLQPASRVRITNTVNVTKIGRFVSSADFQADKEGRVDLSRDAPLNGSYSGLLPMGLFVSLAPGAELRKGSRALVRDVEEPWRHTLTLRCLADGRETSTTVLRSFLHPGVRKVEVNAGRLRGSLFVHRDGVPRPGVLDLYGGGGGLMEQRAALLASRGFTALSLAYFAYQDLPKTIDERNPVELEYFQEAAEWLATRPQVKGEKIGIVGLSLGGFFGDLLAVHYPQRVAAVVNISGMDRVSSAFYLTVAGRLFGRSSSSNDMDWEDGMWKPRRYQESLEGGEEVHLSASPRGTKFLHAVGSEDAQEASSKAQKLWQAEMERAGRLEDWEALCYEGAGHLLEAPHQPFCPLSYVKSFNVVVLWGGLLEPHARAQVDLWRRIQGFLSEHVGKPVPAADQHMAKL